MKTRLPDFLEWMQVRNYSERTVHNARICVGYFIAWCEERSVFEPRDVTKSILERYQHYLFHYRNEKTEKPLSFRSQNARLVPVRSFFRWLTQYNHILYNPASELELPRLEKRLPKHVLTTSEAETVLMQTNVGNPLAD